MSETVTDGVQVIEVGYAQPAGSSVTLGGDLAGISGAVTVVSTHLASPLPITQGGTGAGSGSAALTALGGVSLAGDLGNTTVAPQVTSTHLASPLPLIQGGTGTQAASAGAALTALTGTQTPGYVARSDGTNTALAALRPGDVPTLNQNTTGTAAGLSSTLPAALGGATT